MKTKTISYQKYRQHMTNLAVLKKQLNDTIVEKRKHGAKYREAFRKFSDLRMKEQTIRDKLIDLIPERW